MSRKNNDDILLGHEQAQGRPRAASATGAATPPFDASDTSANHGKTTSKGSPKKSRFRTARGWVALACVVFALAGMAFRVGIGTPSAFGIQQISAICPLGALETMAGAKGVMLHPLLLFVLVAVLIALVGKAFCAWMCPVPWLQKFFRPKKRGTSAKNGAGCEAAAQADAGHDVAVSADAGHDACRDASARFEAGFDAGSDVAAKNDACRVALASRSDSDAGSAQADASASGPVDAANAQTRMVSDASCQKTRECVLPVADECANDALYVATAASGHATNACAADSGSHSPDPAHTRAIFGSKTAEPGKKHLTCAPSACAGCAGASACAKALAPVGGARDGVRLDSRHAVLVGTLASAAVFGFPVFCLICPVGLTFATIIGLWNLVQFNEPTWALVIFPIILIAEVTVLRKWCSKICPISALVSLLSNLNVTLRPRVKADACLRSRGVDCHACVDACPEQLDPHSRRIPECSKCGKCVEACPAKAISIKLLK